MSHGTNEYRSAICVVLMAVGALVLLFSLFQLVEAGTTYKVWVIAHEGKANTPTFDVCVRKFGPTDANNCQFFNFGHLFEVKGHKADFVAGYINLYNVDDKPTNDYIVEMSGANNKYYFYQPIKQDSKGFYVAHFHFTEQVMTNTVPLTQEQKDSAIPMTGGCNGCVVRGQEQPQNSTPLTTETENESNIDNPDNTGLNSMSTLKGGNMTGYYCIADQCFNN